MRAQAFIPAGLVLCTALSAHAVQGAKPQAQKVVWDGEWTLQRSGDESLEALVNAHLKDENFAMRLFWKRKILAACPEFTKLDLLSGDGLSITMGKERPIDTPGDGSTADWKRSDDEAFKASFRREGSTLIQTLQGDGYTVTYVYSMRKDGESLALQVTYSHPKLANPFTWKRVFRRSG